jgi:hypothetical protein
MENKEYSLILADSKKTIQLAVIMIGANVVLFVLISLFRIEGLRPQFIWLIFFVVTIFWFLNQKKKNTFPENVLVKEDGIDTHHFGTLLFSDVSLVSRLRINKGMREKLIFNMKDLRKISFTAAEFKNRKGTESYEQFKEVIKQKFPDHWI